MLVLTRRVGLPLSEQDPQGGTQEVLQEDQDLLLEGLLLQRALLIEHDLNQLLHERDLEVQDQRVTAVPQMKREPK